MQVIILGADLYLNKLTPSVGPQISSTKKADGGPVEGGGPEGTNDREETPPPLTKEQIEGHVSALKSLIKSHNQRNKGDPIRLDFESEDTEVRDMGIAKGKEVMDEDLGKPFKEARRIPLTRRIIEFAGPEYKMPANFKLYDDTTDPEDHLTRGWFERLPHDSINEWADLREAFPARKMDGGNGFYYGVPEVMQISSFMDSVKSPELTKRFSNKFPTTVNEMMERLDDFVRSEEAYVKTELPKREVGETYRKTSLPFNRRDNRTHPRIFDQAPKRNPSYGNATTSSSSPFHVKSIKSGKLNHLVKDARQRGRGPHDREAPQPAKVINTINLSSIKDKKRKGREITEPWMNIPISFPAISSEDVSEEPLIVEAEVEGYLVRRVYADEGSSVEVMFEHCFEKLDPRIRAKLKETQTDLVGFGGEISKPLGKIELKEPSDMTGMTRRIIEHTLNVNPSMDSVCQKRRTFSMEKSGVVKNEVAEWVKAGIVRLPALKTIIPLPNIDCKVESVMRFIYKCFLDAYKGYHQIQMAEEDEEKMAFYTDQGTYCYTKMPFGLKNARATYKRLVDSTFQYQIRRNLEAYVDDMVIKSKDEKMLLAD
uniref:Reverse transcriptase domain-containing protein n=1 Tax=Tanacetum cinerariifolium TaxID=118510 RepID=A0A699HLN6_TANCI|nr:reverse transcriptase domain-containing protein [Tanacetum cinerariifolium]